MLVRGDGNVGIGSSAPAYALDIQRAVSGGNQGIRFIESSDGGSDPAHFIGYRSRGTSLSSPTTIQSSNNMTQFGMGAFDGTDYAVGAKVMAIAAETWDTSGHGTEMTFFTTPIGSTTVTERMSIDSAGNKIMGAVTHAGIIAGSSSGASFNSAGSLFSSRATGSTSIHFRFFNSTGGSTAVGSISTNSSATAYNTSSDYRLKENVDYNWDATTRLKQLKPARFNFISDNTNTLVDGFLAHEVSSIVPEAITGEKDGVQVWDEADELPVWVEGEELPDGVSVGDTKVSAGDNKLDADGNTTPDMQGIDQSKLVPLLVKTIQELEARITALEG
jgi:hypothetical protein